MTDTAPQDNPAGMGHNSDRNADGTFKDGNTPAPKQTPEQLKKRKQINDIKADTQLDMDAALAKTKNLAIKARIDIINYAMGYDKKALPNESPIKKAIDKALARGNGLRDVFTLMAQHDDRANGKAANADPDQSQAPPNFNAGSGKLG